MNIAILSTTYFPEHNGASIRVEGIAEGLSQQGHKITIVVPGPSLQREKTKHAIVWRIPVPRNILSLIIEKFTKFHFSRYRAFKKYLPRILKQENIDIIHTRQPFDLFYAGYTSKKQAAWSVEAHKLLSITDYENKSIGTLHKKMLLAIERKLMNKSDLIITMTLSGKATLQKYGIKKPIIPIPNATALTFKKTKSPFPKKKYLFYAGNLREVEGIDHLLNAYAIIKKTEKNIVCVIAGGGNIKKWKTYAKKLGIQNAVIFLGELPYKDLVPYYQHATLFVHPRKNVTYHKDIIGLKFYDALKSGLPIITSNIGEMSKVIKKHNIGILAEQENDKDVAEKVIKVLHNPKLLTTLKNNARRRGNQSTWKKSCQELSKIYKRM